MKELKNVIIVISVIVIYIIILTALIINEQLEAIKIFGYICGSLIPVYIVWTHLRYRGKW